MESRKELLAAVEGKLAEIHKTLEMHFNIAVGIPPIKYRLRGTAAGRMNRITGVIDFNYLLLRDNAEAFIANTVPHEFAHHAVGVLYGDVQFPHGQEWQRVMEVLGVEPRITHDYDVSMINRLYQWACKCTTHLIPRKIHRDLVRGQPYDCSSCGNPISAFVG